MPGANEKVTVTVDILGDISKFQSSVKAMQTELGKLQLPGNLKEGFSQIFTDLEREINKIQTIGSKKKIDLVDSKALTKSFSTMEGLYSKLLHKMQNSGMKTSLFEKDVQALQKVNNLLNAYDAKIKSANKSMGALNGQVTKQTNNLKKLEGKEGFQVISDEAYQDAQNKLDNLKKAYQDATKAAKSAEGTDEYSALLAKQTEATKRLEEAKRSMANVKSESQYQAEIEKTTRNLELAKQKVEEFKNSNKSVETQAWQELINQLTKLQGIDWSRFGIDPSKISSVEELQTALEKMGNTASQDAAAGIKDVEVAAENMGSSLNDAVAKAEQTAQSLRDLGDRQRDIQQLASRLTQFFSLTNQFMIMRRIIQNAITTIKELDKAMTETAVVTDFNVADMWAQLPEYTKVANELGATTKGAYETMTLFYQQGLNQQQAFQLGTETMKMARIAGLDYAEATDRMTNALRGFNMELNDTSSQRVNDVYSNLAAKSASNVDELSTAMTKTASIAHAANMEFETTAAFLAQIIETTRESAETAGTALKTVIARFSEVKKLYSEGELTGQDEEGEQIDVNRVSTALRAAGVNLNEYLTGAKGLDEVFIELASKWDSLDLVTQRYIATMAAGSRQQSRFIALMQDYSRQTELVSIAENAAGASQQQFQKTLDSLEAKLNKLSNAWNEFTMGIANSSLIKGAIDLITGLITAINKVTAALGPVGGAITKVLLLFAGFKGIRALFDKFVGHIATVYVNAAKAAAKGGTAAGTAYGNSFLASSKAALSKFKNIFVNVTSSSFNINSKAIQDAQKALQQYTAAQIASAEAKDLVIQKEGEEALATSLSTDAIAARTAATEADNATTAYKNALVAMGVTNEEIQSAIISGEIPLQELLTAVESEEAKTTLLQTLADKGYTEAQLENVRATITNITAQNGLQTTSVSLFKKLAAGIMVLFGYKTANEAAAWAAGADAAATEGLTIALEHLQAAIPWLLAITAAIIAIAVAMRANEEFSLEGHIKDLEGVSKSLDEELKAVQERLDKFDEHTSAIEEITDTLDEATIGTTEWKNAVADLNNEYIELSKIIGSDFWNHVQIVNGRIVAEEGYIDSARQESQDQEQSLKNQGYAIDATLQQLNLQKKLEDLGKNVGTDIFLGQFNEEKYKQQIEEYRAAALETSAQVDATFELLGSSLQNDSINLGAYSKIVASSYNSALKENQDLISTMDFFGQKNVELSKQYAEIMNKSYQGMREYEVDASGNISYLDLETQERHDDESSFSQIYERVLYDQLQNQDTESLYKETIQKLVDGVKEAADVDIDESLMAKIVNGDYTYDDVKDLGPEIWSAINKTFEDNSIPVQIEPVLMEKGSDAIKEEIENLISKANINIDSSQLIKATNRQGIKSFTDLFNTKITGNKDEFSSLFMGLDNFTDAEEFASVMEHLGSIDFSSKKDWEALPKWLEDAGIEIPDSELQTFINKCEELAHAIDKIDFTKIEEQLGTLYSSLDKLRSGDIDATAIDEDTYNSLLESGVVDAEDFRKNLATGEYVYIEGQDSLETAIYAAIQALDKNAEAQLEAAVQANQAIEDSFGENARQNLLTQLSSDSSETQLYGIQRIFDTWKNANVDIDSLGIDGLNSDTNIGTLTPEQTEAISAAITEAILNGTEDAKARQEQYQNNTDYTEAATFGEQNGYSFLENEDAVNTAFQSIDNFNAKLEQTKQDFASLGNIGDKAWKGLTKDIDDAKKAAVKFDSVMESNLDVLKDMNNPKFDDAFKDLTDAMSEIFQAPVDSSFVEKHLDDIIKYYETGSEDIAASIRDAFTREEFIPEINPEVNLDNAYAVLDELVANIDNYQGEIEVNGYADVSDIVNKLIAVGYTAEQAMAIVERCAGLQITPHTEMKPVKSEITYFDFGSQQPKTKTITSYVPEVTYKAVNDKGSGFSTITPRSPGGGGKGKGGGGGGGGSDKEPEDNRDWKNPYDKLYNSYAKLEELQRKRNNLEKEFALTVDTAAGSVAKTTQQFKEQLKNLQAQADTQEKIVSGKKSQIANAQNKTYSVEDHVVKSYATAFKDAIDESNKSHGTSFSSNLADYAKYNTSTGQMEIDWNQIQSLEGKIDSAAGEVLEAYVSELEGLEDQLEEAQDALIDIKTEIKAAVDQAMEDRIAYVDAMREAMISQYQKQIDKLSALNDAINESNQRIFDSLQQQIDLERQIRDNTKTEDEIAQNEARLAYLQRDTSGANDLEIQKLQQTLADQRENYSDTLVDQELARLQDQADEAAAQREHQIELMDAQLQFWQDTGYFEELIDKGISEGKAMEIYKDYTDYANKTRAEQAKIMQDFYSLFNKGGSANTAALAAADAQYNGGKYKVKDSKGNTYDVSYDAGTGTWKGKDINGKAFSLTAEQITSADTNKKILSTSVSLSDKAATSGSGGGGGGGTPAKTQNTSTSTTNAPSYPYGKASDTSGNIKKGAKGSAVKAIQYALNKLGYGNSGTKSVDGVFGSGTANAVKAFQKAMGISADGIVGKNTRAKFKAKGYSTGGLADYTGPAWLHGSPSKPELVLNAKDTENFIQLKNILADVAKDSKSGSSGGDNYFDIKVEVGEIGSDYDVEKMITKIKDEIDQDARYRNVNSINFIR